MRGLALLDPEVADLSSVVRHEKFLSEEDIDAVRAAASKLRASQGVLSDNIPAMEFRDPVFLQKDGFFSRELPGIYDKICTLVTNVDCDNWKMLDACGKELGVGVNARCVEFHEYGQHAHARKSCGDHYDSGSLITVDIMLSCTSEFEGGRFQTSAMGGEGAARERKTSCHNFERGDAIVFASNKHHSVAPVTSGIRCVLVLEFWEGSACASAHRCMNTSCGGEYVYDCDNDEGLWL